jgi:4-amino-4-deoxy-L-arabinose transferase
MSLFGQNNFANRLPAALAAGVSALLLMFLLARRAGTRTGLIAAGVLLSSILVFVLGVFNVLDGPFSMCITGTMVFFYMAYSEADKRRRIVMLCLCGLFCGLAFLTKGFLAFALPVIVVAPFLAWERRWKAFLTMPWMPAVAALLIALPWCVMIAIREPDFWNYFFWIEHVGRFIKPGQPQHPEPFWYFLPILIGGALPWTTLFPAAAAGIKKMGLNSLLRFAICWLTIPFLFFSASGGKLGTYILPCFVPLALIMAVGLEHYLAGGGRKLFSAAAVLTAVSTALLAIVLIVLQTTDAFAYHLYKSDEAAKWLPIAAALIIWAILAASSARSSEWRLSLALFCAGPMLFFASTHMALSREMADNKAPEAFLARCAPLVTANTVLVSDDYVGPAVSWVFKRTDILVVGAGGELKYGLKYADTAQKLLSGSRLNELITEVCHDGRDLVIIMDHDRYVQNGDLLPKANIERIEGGFVMLLFHK